VNAAKKRGASASVRLRALLGDDAIRTSAEEDCPTAAISVHVGREYLILKEGQSPREIESAAAWALSVLGE
jgi:hypothetical protein